MQLKFANNRFLQKKALMFQVYSLQALPDGRTKYIPSTTHATEITSVVLHYAAIWQILCNSFAIATADNWACYATRL